MCFRVPGACLSLLLGLLMALPSAADTLPVQGQQALQDAARAFLQEQLDETGATDAEVQVGQVDSRLRLAACPSPQLEAFLPAGSRLGGKLTVGVRCSGPKPWTLYLPAEIKLFAEVVVASQPLPRGIEITAQHVSRSRKDVSDLHAGYFTALEQVIGKIATKPIKPGDVLTPQRLKAPLLVRRGEDVTIIAAVGGLEVRSKGTALADAAQGETVNVRNLQSKRVVQGTVISAATVGINM
jgi:flagella basal body P-ring formation protein FlgA